MFQTTKSAPSTNNLKNSIRIKTNMSLTELVESNQSNQSNQRKYKNNFKNNNNNNNNNHNNNHNNQNNKNKFYNNNNKTKIIKPEFKITMEEFPVLIGQSQGQSQTQSQIQTQIQSQNKNYSEKLKLIKADQENYKTRISNPLKEYKKKIMSDSISEYYNPSLSVSILNRRAEYREELNEMLGDISPYWNKTTHEELSDLDDDEIIISDNDDEYNNSIIEDW